MNTIPRWRTFEGRIVELSEMEHQHLSNIMYYFELVTPKEALSPLVQEELNKRFAGVRLPYRPRVDFEFEISVLVKKGYTLGYPDDDIVVDGKCIGKVIYPA